jgi:ferritin-like metal-binding protein YciE
MKSQTIKQYSNMIEYCETTLREHWGMGADPIKLIGLAEEIGMQDLADEFKEQLKEEKEEQKEIQDNLHPHFNFIKTFSSH